MARTRRDGGLMEPIYFEIFLKAQDLTAANCSRDEL
jgi:hypothetical protein